MGVWMVIAALLFLDLMMAAGVAGNRRGVFAGAIIAGIAGYTLLFLAVSAAWHPRDLP
jgi:hypothetical protein